MKCRLHKKLLSFAVAEILSQLGFERCTSQCMAILSDLLEYYAESLLRRIQSLEDIPSDLAVMYLLKSTYDEEQYQYDELLQFIEQQRQLKSLIKDVSDEPPSLMHALRILPPDFKLETPGRTTSHLGAEEKNRPAHVIAEAEVDDFLREFIEKSIGEGRTRERSYECTDVSDIIGTGEGRRIRDPELVVGCMSGSPYAKCAPLVHPEPSLEMPPREKGETG